MSKEKKPEEGDGKKWMGRVLEGMEAGRNMQTQFKAIPSAHLNRETVAGIRDMSLGRVRNGEPVGAPIIRFDSGHGSRPHINIDPNGVPHRSNPHIEVSEGVIKGAKVANTTLKYVGRGLMVASIAIDTWRLGSAFKDDLYIREHADEIIQELEEVIEELRGALKTKTNSKERQNIREDIEEYEKCLKEVKRTKVLPCKAIKTTASIAGGWGAGAAGASGGAWAGAQAGAVIGSLFGPVGTVVGAPIGAIVGALGGGVAAGSLGSAGAQFVAEKGLELVDD